MIIIIKTKIKIKQKSLKNIILRKFSKKRLYKSNMVKVLQYYKKQGIMLVRDLVKITKA